jgi:outer membrane murein-binding lipoprotein Lpp
MSDIVKDGKSEEIEVKVTKSENKFVKVNEIFKVVIIKNKKGGKGTDTKPPSKLDIFIEQQLKFNDLIMTKLDNQDKKIETILVKVDKLESKVDNLEIKVDKLEVKVDKLESKVNEVKDDLDNIVEKNDLKR